MPYGVPRGFILQNIVYAYFLVFEKEKSSAFFPLGEIDNERKV